MSKEVKDSDDKLPEKELTVKKFLENIDSYIKEHRDVAFYAELAGMESESSVKIIED